MPEQQCFVTGILPDELDFVPCSDLPGSFGPLPLMRCLIRIEEDCFQLKLYTALFAGRDSLYGSLDPCKWVSSTWGKSFDY